MTANELTLADDDRPAPPASSTRTAIAEIAADAATGVRGVSALVGQGPLQRVRTAAGAIEGVAVFPEGDGEHCSVDVWIRARLVDLHALGTEVRRAVAQRAEQAGLGGALGQVAVHIIDIDTTEVTP